MIRTFDFRDTLRVALVGGLSMLLAACMLVPGKFTSELVLMRDGTFSYSYDGEIHLMSMSKLAQMGSVLEKNEFVAESCYDEETYDVRECTAEEVAQQRTAYEEMLAEKVRTDTQETEQMKQIFGGIDPTDPASGDELAKQIERQAGFDKVVHKGEGVFEVGFKVSGRLDHDFIFPTFERLPVGNYFLFAGRRDDGSVRVDAPGFAPQTGANPMLGMMGGMGQSSGKGDMPPGVPMPSGTFTIITDGEILANNTDEGAATDPRGKTLTWTVGTAAQSAQSAPTALIKLNN